VLEEVQAIRDRLVTTDSNASARFAIAEIEALKAEIDALKKLDAIG
jgi:hypothetical protein